MAWRDDQEVRSPFPKPALQSSHNLGHVAEVLSVTRHGKQNTNQTHKQCSEV